MPGCLGSKSGEKPFLCGVKIHGHSKLPPSHSNSVKSILEFQVQRHKIAYSFTLEVWVIRLADLYEMKKIAIAFQAHLTIFSTQSSKVFLVGIYLPTKLYCCFKKRAIS